MAGHQPDRGHGQPANRQSRAPRAARRSGYGRRAASPVVGQRLTHPHEHHVGDPVRRPGGPPGTSPRASDRAAATTCSTISAVDRLRVSPACPVAQNGQAMPQPAWLETQTVSPLGVAHQHALDQRAVEQPPGRLDGSPAVAGLPPGHGEQAGQTARRPARCRVAAGRSVIWSGSSSQPVEVVHGQLTGSERLLPRPGDHVGTLGEGEVGEVARWLGSASGTSASVRAGAAALGVRTRRTRPSGGDRHEVAEEDERDRGGEQ